MITVVLMCNVTWPDMLLPLVVTKVKNPRVFQTNRGVEIFYEYFYNNTTWVTLEFLSYSQKLNSILDTIIVLIFKNMGIGRCRIIFEY